MIIERVNALTKSLEDPENPLLGPTLKALNLFGLWQTGSKFCSTVYNVIHISTVLFTLSQFVDLYLVKHDLNKVLNNMSLTVLSVICVAKCFSYILCQNSWKSLVKNIAKEEIFQNNQQDIVIRKGVHEYMKYSRRLTYMYWLLVFGTNFFLIATPFLKYLSSQNYQDEIKSGSSSLPQIFCSWFPFDNNKMPGYIFGVVIHIFMASQGSGVLAAYDTNAVSIMCYLKGQMIILEQKCNNIFDEVTSAKVFLDRIKECHRHHTALIMHYKIFNSLLSPVMFLYVLLCSITICGSVVQFSSKEVSTSQKIWIVEYTGGLITQLFLYCWYSNEVAVQSFKIDGGVYKSDWWQAEVGIRKQVLLLAGKLNQPFILAAGPYTTLSIPTFIAIMKGSYSFYTLFSKIQDEKNT